MKNTGNIFFLLVVLASVAFIVTALAYSLVPFHAQPNWLQEYGWAILLVEVGIIIIVGLLSMVLDRPPPSQPEADTK